MNAPNHHSASRTAQLFPARIGLTLLVTSLAVAIHWIPQAAEWLQFDRQAIAGGQWWRLLSGHLTHWNTDHLVWDAVMFGVLGCMIELDSRPRLLALMLGSAAAISGFTWLARPDLETYRGLSGVDTALFVYLALTVTAAALKRGQWLRTVVPGLLLAGFVGKLLFEAVTGTTLFVDSTAAGFAVLLEVHLLGAVAGGLVAGASVARSLCSAASIRLLQPDPL